MNKEEAKKLYEGKHFYEIVKPISGGIQLFGPFDSIRYARDTSDGFVQVVDGNIVAFFTKDEILVTDRIL